MSSAANVAWNTLTNQGRMLVQMAVFFFITPLMTRSLGPDDFGVWSLVFSVLGLFALLDSGFGTGVVKVTAETRGSGDSERRNGMLSTMLFAYLALACAGAVLLALFSPLFPAVAGASGDGGWRAVGVLWILGLRMVVLQLPLSLFRGILFGTRRIAQMNAVQAVCTVGYGLAAWFSLTSGHGILALAWLNLGAMLAEHAAYVFMVLRNEPGLRLAPGLVQRAHWREALSLSAATFVVQVAALVLLRMDPVIVRMFMPVAAVGVYTIALRLSEQAFLLTKQFVNVLTPLVAELHGAGERARTTHVMLAGARLALAMTAAIAVPMWVLGHDAILFWVGPEYAGAAAPLHILLAAMLIGTPQMAVANVLTMTGHHKAMAGAALTSMLLNVAFSVPLAALLGMPGVALGTLAATVIVDVFIVVRRGCILQGTSFSGFWTHTLGRVAPLMLVQGAATLGLKMLAPPENLFILAAEAALGGLAALPVAWFVVLEAGERRMFLGRLRRIAAGKKLDKQAP